MRYHRKLFSVGLLLLLWSTANAQIQFVPSPETTIDLTRADMEVLADTTALKLEGGTEGKTVWLKELSSTNPIGGGAFTLTDSTTYLQPDQGRYFASGTTGLVWKRQANRFTADMWGFHPDNDSTNNQIAHQNSLNGGDIVLYVDIPGEYDFDWEFYVDDNTHIYWAPGTSLKKCAYAGALRTTYEKPGLSTAEYEQRYNAFVYVNRGAFTRTTNTDITIDGLYLKINGVTGINSKTMNLCGSRGELNFWGVNNLVINNYQVYDLDTVPYGLQVADFNNVRITNSTLHGNKNPIVINKGRRLVIENVECKTYENPLVITSSGYYTGTPEIGSISDVIVRGLKDLEHDTLTAGTTIATAPVAIPAWSSGMALIQGDMVLYDGNIYQVVVDGAGWSGTSTVAPTHDLSSDSLWKFTSDGISWRWKQADSIREGSITNCSIYDVTTQRKRPLFVNNIQVDSTFGNRPIYPGEEIPLLQINFNGIIDLAEIGGWEAEEYLPNTGLVFQTIGNCDLTASNILTSRTLHRSTIGMTQAEYEADYQDIYSNTSNVSFSSSRLNDVLLQEYDVSSIFHKSTFKFSNLQQTRNLIFEVLDGGTDTVRVTGDVSIHSVAELIPVNGDQVRVNWQPVVYKDEWVSLPQPNYDIIEFHYNTRDSLTLDGYIEGTADSTVTFSYGDGFTDLDTLAGTTDLDFDYTYAASDTFGARIFSIYGDLNAITRFVCNNDVAFSGDSKTLSRLPALTSIDVSNTKFGGDADWYNELTALTILQINNSNTRGYIDSVADLTNLTRLYAYNCPRLKGNFSTTSGMTSMEYFLIKESPMPGNLNVLANFSNLISAQIYDMDVDSSEVIYTTAVWPASSTVVSIDVSDNYLTSAMVDLMFSDLATAVIAGAASASTFTVDGTNAARTSASDADKQTLVDSSWTVNVNE